MVGGWAVDMETYQTPNMDTSKHQTPNMDMRTHIKGCQSKTQTHKQTF